MARFNTTSAGTGITAPSTATFAFFLHRVTLGDMQVAMQAAYLGHVTNV
jgi:hypothetical protein